MRGPAAPPTGAFLTQRHHPADGDGGPGSDRQAAAPPVAARIDAGVDDASQATLLLRRRRDVSDAEAQLQARKVDYHERMRQLGERAARLAQRRAALEATTVKFAAFLAENAARVDKAAAKERAEAQAAARLDVELARVRGEAARAHGELAAAAADGARLRRAADYLLEVQRDCEGGVGGVRDVVSRHAALAASNRDLHAQRAAAEAALAALRALHAATTRALQDRALQAACQQSQQAKALDAAQERIDAAQARADGEEQRRLADKVTWGELQAALRNIYCRVIATAPPTCFGRLQVQGSLSPSSALSCFSEMLYVIRDRIVSLAAITGAAPGGSVDAARS